MIWDKIKPYLKNRTIVFFRNKGIIGKLILGSQSIYTIPEFGFKSMFTHIGIVMDGYFYESTVKKEKVGKKKKLVYGCIKSRLEDRFSKKKMKKSYSALGFQHNLHLSDENWTPIKAKGEQLITNKVKYGGQELFGTLFRLIRWRFAKKSKKDMLLQKDNRFNKSNVYCVAHTADCIEASGVEYIDVNHSISTVDEAWFDCKIACRNKLLKL